MDHNNTITDTLLLLQHPANFSSIQTAAKADTLATQIRNLLPCGLYSFLGTHYEIASFITQRLTEERASESKRGPWVIYTENSGYMELYNLAVLWTIEFETRHKNTDWEVEDWWNEIMEFLLAKQQEIQ